MKKYIYLYLSIYKLNNINSFINNNRVEKWAVANVKKLQIELANQFSIAYHSRIFF